MSFPPCKKAQKNHEAQKGRNWSRWASKIKTIARLPWSRLTRETREPNWLIITDSCSICRPRTKRRTMTHQDLRWALMRPRLQEIRISAYRLFSSTQMSIKFPWARNIISNDLPGSPCRSSFRSRLRGASMPKWWLSKRNRKTIRW